ncbi:MAG: hypothetical protein JW715_07375 [Sedimentisphaerales bacterium]|nr:hypothetical protein [Sedimentisphaerales bacterium]
MIKNTIFVLGAGASCPYGFPSGRDLHDQIIKHHIDDWQNYINGKEDVPDFYVENILAHAKEFVETFRKSTTPSIDLFIARNKNRYGIHGKQAIAFRILAAEKESSFRERAIKRDQDWYEWLFVQLTNKIINEEDFNHFNENEISIITFNYDRSLEHFLYDSLRNSFKGVGNDKIIEQLNKIKICHIFNQVAYLEWQNQPNYVGYRIESQKVNIDELAKNIVIVHDEQENPKLQEAHDLLSNAQRVFFLGFGYAKENLEALKIPETLANVTSVFGTGLNLTEKEVAIYESIFKTGRVRGKKTFIKKDFDCLKLLKEWM